jgi:hypothetical protein
VLEPDRVASDSSTFASLAPSRATSREFDLFKVDGVGVESKSKAQRGRRNRKKTFGRGNGVVEEMGSDLKRKWGRI